MTRSILLACTLLACLDSQAEPALNVQRSAHHRADGQGHGAAQRGGTFSTANGAQGARSQHAARSGDGAFNAGSRAAVSGENGSAQGSKSFTRSADGGASGQRSTRAANAQTGVTYEGSTTFTKGSGIARSGGCTNAAGDSVTCGSAR
jgi:hypothetical protein